jgi:predicted nucleotidyltransferase
MLAKLFGSDARVKVLSLFMLNAGNEYYLREIAQKTSLAIRSVQRTVEDLTEIGILQREKRGNSVYFRLRDDVPILSELKTIFLKTVGLGALLRQMLAEQKGIQIAFIYGSVAKGEEEASSDIDVAIIGDLSSRQLTSELVKLERELGREINATVFTPTEWFSRGKKRDHFVRTLIQEPKIFLIGDNGDLEALSET